MSSKALAGAQCLVGLCRMTKKKRQYGNYSFFRDGVNPQEEYRVITQVQRRYTSSSIQSDNTSTLSRINLALKQVGEVQQRALSLIGNMAANTMSMMSCQSALTARSGSSKPFTGQPIKPTRAIVAPRSRSHVVKASAQVFRRVGRRAYISRCQYVPFISGRDTWSLTMRSMQTHVYSRTTAA